MESIIRNKKKLSAEIKRDLRNSIILATVAYGSEVWKCNEAEQSRVQAVEINYMRTSAEVTLMDGFSNEEVYGMAK